MNHSNENKEATRAVDFKVLKVTSTAFEHEGMIPVRYTCDGDNVNPPLHIEHIPEEAKCLALIVDDPDAPKGTWVHWVVFNMPVTHHIKENTVHGTQGVNDFRQNEYGGPCPPSGTHRYYFKIYALDELLDLTAVATKAQVEKAMSEHLVAFGELVGLYKRNR